MQGGIRQDKVKTKVKVKETRSECGCLLLLFSNYHLEMMTSATDSYIQIWFCLNKSFTITFQIYCTKTR